MSDPLFDAADDAATPLTPEERDALIPTYITLRRELNEAEQIGIADADRWAFSRQRDVLDEDFLRALHRRMFRSVWKWAGAFRTTPRNIGVEAWRIAPDLRQLLGDARYWVDHQTYPPDEIAVRFHHRLVWIHPFPNGNGRFSRLAADRLAVQMGAERFSWGGGNLVAPAELRRRYIEALRAADGEVIAPLVAFARS
ncbi:MAG: mobile mystery protein B [Phenylobacterium sp.]|uniref:mobile mystery protein B n=1 Tax=Phenylobacterium sp. TaxID=1871053 RepID=UPI0025E3D4AC|nr:mobile mystery protein B [Phenylobacterium sp.]MCA6246111.1 mobile mystery protein B [Phenylobacterium sp.]MCA6256097.1 mobile mystery protein B [Phenylobacterium sp.]